MAGTSERLQPRVRRGSRVPRVRCSPDSLANGSGDGDCCHVDCGDITGASTWAGWLYVVFVTDVCSRMMVGCQIVDHMGPIWCSTRWRWRSGGAISATSFITQTPASGQYRSWVFGDDDEPPGCSVDRDRRRRTRQSSGSPSRSPCSDVTTRCATTVALSTITSPPSDSRPPDIERRAPLLSSRYPPGRGLVGI